MDNIRDDASAWFESQGQDIQDYEVPPMPEADIPTAEPIDDIPADDRPFADSPDVTSTDVRNVINLQAINRPTASVIVGVMDTILPILITAIIVRGSELDDAKLTDDERETLIQAWAVYLGDKNVQASPTVVLITTILTIYGAKIFAAIQNRKVLEQQRLIESQAAELEVLKAEKEQLEAKINQKGA